MSWLLLTLVLAAPCEHPAVQALPDEDQAAACAYLSQPAPQAVARGPIAEIYGRPGFERARLRNTGALQALLAQLQHWFEQLAQTSGAQTYSNFTRVFVLALALLVGGAVALRFAFRKRLAAPVELAPRSTAAPLELEDPARHLARADALLAQAPREALREGLLALLSSLEQRRLARPDRVKTNRELVEELTERGAPAALVQEVRPVFAWYDRAFYSLNTIDEPEARQFLADVRRLTGGAA